MILSNREAVKEKTADGQLLSMINCERWIGLASVTREDRCLIISRRDGTPTSWSQSAPSGGDYLLETSCCDSW